MDNLQSRMLNAIQTLESYYSKIEVFLSLTPTAKDSLSVSTADLKKGIQSLQTTFERVQTADLKNDQTELQQALKVFYGIHALLRPEVIAAFVLLAKGYATSRLEQQNILESKSAH